MDNNLRIDRAGHTLVDQVEEKLIDYFKEQGLRPGDSIPNETELANSLGIGRTVLREALSRFKMTGMIESRTKRGMTLAEPSILSSLKRSMNPLLMTEKTLIEILEFRIALEVGSTSAIFANITPEYIEQLEDIVKREELGEIPLRHLDESTFHRKLYEIMDNRIIAEFQETIIPSLDYIVEGNRKLLDELDEMIETHTTHRELLDHIKNGDEEGYVAALKRHFKKYTLFFMYKRNNKG